MPQNETTPAEDEVIYMTINKEIVARYIPAHSQIKNGEILYDYSDGKIKGMEFLND